jgi:hypothetical protein
LSIPLRLVGDARKVAEKYKRTMFLNNQTGPIITAYLRTTSSSLVLLGQHKQKGEVEGEYSDISLLP